jgi:hypothetical protein
MRDWDVLRRLAGRWAELGNQPVMAERARLWTALKDLRAERPMILFETNFLENYIAECELECQHPYLREVELCMRWNLRHAEEIGDDLVLPPQWQMGWEISSDGYGVALSPHHSQDAQGGTVAYTFDYPIRTFADIDKLRPRTWQVDRALTHQKVEMLSAIFGDLLPVRLHGTAGLHAGLTQDLYKLIGNDNLLLWTYDAPDALHRLMTYLRNDRLAFHNWLEREGLLGFNHGPEMAGSGSPGFTSALPQPGGAGSPRLCDVWAWMESQETTMISPRMFGRFFLPYMADVSRPFGLVYYGCCEPVHDRWELVRAAIPQVRAVSISPWSNQRLMAERLGKAYVFSRKPKAAPLSGASPDWDALRDDLIETAQAARDCNLEIVYRDVYRISDRACLRRWVEMARSIF